MELCANECRSVKTWRLKVIHNETTCEVDDLTEEKYQDALYEAARQSGANHPDVGEAASYLADLYLYLERYQEAEVLYRRALKIYARAYGNEHMIYSMALRNLAVALQARGKFAESRALRQQARGIFG